MTVLRDAAAGGGRAEPFANVEDAWFWTCGAMLARQQGVRSGGSGPKRPCDPDDVILCVERLLRTGQIDSHHARVLGIWGQQGMPPPRHNGHVRDYVPWSEAMTAIEAALKRKGIVHGVRE